MELNRNQWFAIGILLILIGAELRWIDTFVLNEKTASFIATNVYAQEYASAGPIQSAMYQNPPASRRTFKPPRWIGLSLISVGSVIVLYSLTLKRLA